MKRLYRWFFVLAFLGMGNGMTKGQTVSKLMNNGPDGEKLTFVVMGDGYAAKDQAKFAGDVQKLVVQGVFGHDFYKDNAKAFNLYQISLISKQSGVSSLQFSKNTALKVIFSGKWNRCWLEESPETDQLITEAASKVAKYDYVLVIANEGGYGGCRRGSRLYVTSGDDWSVVAHEYGHGIAGLYDEYTVQGTGVYSGAEINVKNCSVTPDRDNVVWSQLIDPKTDIPTDSSKNIDVNQTVGIFTGCDYAEKRIYRPVKDCRMNSNDRVFCPVCLRLMNEAVKPFLPEASASTVALGAAPPQSGSGGTYLNMVIRIGKNQKVAVLKATELQGNPIASQQGSPSYFLAFNKDSEPSYADFLPENPYLVRGFADPKHPEKGENISFATTATIIVNVPKTDIASATQNLGFQLYSANPGTVNVVPSESNEELRSLLQKPGVKMELNISPSDLGVAVNSKAVKVDHF
jgi:IgA Peptidase M64